ncbi:acetyltransferas-like protein [Cucurbitaria berberidis CBS 394.84]|uniref:Acetyltransferas-like protein n=1 Tax=Cucurbitaria berberidis CBS 394.84 TaxID=1168544 RepID=A0A9P4GHT9_9PLEO|nr:acetyltransferas-like protein [Cucurbitaria berberidis CBS 394.84]KAF1845441.1 acetyltransferas-like protein [Cucurbitaria berberidis CBS 394.84]
MQRHSPTPSWTLQPTTPDTIDEVVTFMNHARQDMFPTLSSQLPDDVARWVQSGYFLTARNETQLIATIGYVPYDHRFPQLDYRTLRTVEVVRLFVLPEHRRGGLATALVSALREHARGEGVECLYLHTHPFLPGAIEFWEKRGFQIADVEEDPVWRTTHMQLML